MDHFKRLWLTLIIASVLLGLMFKLYTRINRAIKMGIHYVCILTYLWQSMAEFCNKNVCVLYCKYTFLETVLKLLICIALKAASKGTPYTNNTNLEQKQITASDYRIPHLKLYELGRSCLICTDTQPFVYTARRDSGQMCVQMNRLASFSFCWSDFAIPSPILAQNGFYYHSAPSFVRCFSCERTVSVSGDIDSDPRTWHADDCNYRQEYCNNYHENFHGNQDDIMHERLYEQQQQPDNELIPVGQEELLAMAQPTGEGSLPVPVVHDTDPILDSNTDHTTPREQQQQPDSELIPVGQEELLAMAQPTGEGSLPVPVVHDTDPILDSNTDHTTPKQIYETQNDEPTVPQVEPVPRMNDNVHEEHLLETGNRANEPAEPLQRTQSSGRCFSLTDQSASSIGRYSQYSDIVSGCQGSSMNGCKILCSVM